MGDKVTLSQRRLTQWHLLKKVLERRMSLREAYERMEVSYRHAKRLRHVVARDGSGGLIHGNTGRRPANAIGVELRQKIVALSRTEYGLFNDTHFTEKLLSVEGIWVIRETVRSIRRQAGILPKRRRPPPWHRSRRARKSHEGMMVLWDGSVHQWFGEGHPPCCLVAASSVPLIAWIHACWGFDRLFTALSAAACIFTSVLMLPRALSVGAHT